LTRPIQKRLESFKPNDYDMLIICVTKYDWLTDPAKVEAAAKSYFEKQARYHRDMPKRVKKKMNLSDADILKAQAEIDEDIEKQRMIIIEKYKK